MNNPDLLLFTRLNDLQETLAGDIAWLTATHRPDRFNDLGERLVSLGEALRARAIDLNTAALAKLPAHRWIPAVGSNYTPERVAHLVGEWPIRTGLFYRGACGAQCYPFYGKDTQRKINRHPRCRTCARFS
jgi:hypothetical protein